MATSTHDSAIISVRCQSSPCYLRLLSVYSQHRNNLHFLSREGSCPSPYSTRENFKTIFCHLLLLIYDYNKAVRMSCATTPLRTTNYLKVNNWVSGRGYTLSVAKQSACIALTIAIQRRTAPASNVGRKCNSPKLSKGIHNMLPNCTTLCIINKTTKQKQNAQSETYDYDFKTKLKCTTVQTDAARQI